MDIQTFMNAHYREKESTLTQTNTRIRDDKYGVKGGSYAISDEEYPAFLDIYYRDVIAKGVAEHYTELQLPNNGPLLIDLDFHYAYDCDCRYYTKDHIDDFIGAVLEQLKQMFQLNGDSQFRAYVLEKDAVNRVQEKAITKDGIHVIFGISCERKLQIALRNRMIPVLEEMWTSSLPIINTWNDVYDNSITTGNTGWQLTGSRKPGHEPYKPTYVYSVGYDTSDGEFTIDCQPVANITPQLIKDMSARCNTHPRFFYKSDFIKELDGIPDASPRKQLQLRATSPNSNNMNLQYLKITCEEQMYLALSDFHNSLKESEHDLRELFEYVMALPKEYYETGSYSKWVRVGMALYNTDERLFIYWLVFSSQASTFSYSDVGSLFEKWSSNFTAYNKGGLSSRSIVYWCRSDALAKYKEIRRNSTDYKLEQTLGSYEDVDEDAKIDRKGTTDYDIATILHHMFGDVYKCVSITNNIWYKYEEPRWIKIDAGTTLRKAISNELRQLYAAKANKYLEIRNNLSAENNDAYKIKKIQKFTEKLLSVCARLGSTNDKKNIMVEAKELFYDDKFMEKLDANPYLLCFNNGVVDFKEKVFRRAYPEDYLTKCTNIDYVPIDAIAHKPVIEEIRDFMRKLFPEKDIHDYMWEHLASTLIGVLPNQTWNMYIGDGQNGKSMLVEIMEHVLGEYKGSVASNLITDRRTKIGGACPEIIGLKGLRYAVMQETQKGDRVNEGVMKQLTSGMDTIEARGLYMANVEVFYPQFKMVLCSNYLMDIKSNDHGTWRRIRVVPFKSLFTENPVEGDTEKPYQFKIDLSLRERCKGWAEVFAALFVDIAYETQGYVKDCDAVLAASNAYRESQDYIAEFVGDNITIDPRGSISKTELSVRYKMWYESTYGRGAPNVKEVQAYMDKKFKKKDKKWVGVTFSQGSRDAAVFDDDVPEGFDL
jgi:P4 family phage/plasmid primase-like protien